MALAISMGVIRSCHVSVPELPHIQPGRQLPAHKNVIFVLLILSVLLSVSPYLPEFANPFV